MMTAESGIDALKVPFRSILRLCWERGITCCIAMI